MLEAIDSSVNGGGSLGLPQFQSYGDSNEEELTVLPPHTKVVVTGNNRTKSVLVGLQGVVKKAVGLGGWHWLVLTNGIEVKLQRNALSVIEGPTGNENDDVEMENGHSNGSEMASEDTQKTQLHINQKSQSWMPRQRKNKSPGSSHKEISRTLSSDSQCKGSVSSALGFTSFKVDLTKLSTESLWRYCQKNKLATPPSPTGGQMLELAQKHFDEMLVDEMEAISGFVRACNKMVESGGK